MKTSTCILCLLVLIVVVTLTKRREPFGMSPGTLTQLQSTSMNNSMSMPTPGSRPYFLV